MEKYLSSVKEELSNNILGELYLINSNAHWFDIKEPEIALRALFEIVRASGNMNEFAKRALAHHFSEINKNWKDRAEELESIDE